MRPAQQFGDDVADEDLSAARAKGILWPGVVTMLRGSAQRRGAAIVAAVTGIINGTTMVLGATAIGWTTDNFIVPSFTTGAIEAGALWTAVVFILGVSTFRWSTILIRGMATGRVQFWAQASTRRDITRQYQKLDLSWHRKHSPGQLLANTVSDVEAMWNPMQFFYFAVGMVVMLVIAVVNLFLLDPSMGVIGLVLITAVLGINVLYQRVIAGRARAAQQARAGVAQVAHESFEGEQVVRTLGLEARENERFASRVDRLRDANTRMGYVSAVFDPLLELLPTASVLVVLGVGSAQVAEGGLSVGVLVEIIYLLLTISLPLNIISRFLAVLPMSAVGAERTRAVLNSTEFTRFGDRTWGGRGAPAVSVRSASFSLGGHSVLRDIDVDIAAGEVVALVGATGAGKSSLVGIIARLVDPDSGAVCFDGVPAVELAEGQLSTHVAVAPQEVFLFDDTVRANVTLGGPPGANPQSGAVADEGAIPDYSDDQVWDALRLAGADKFVEQLPEGINTPLGQRGSSLSGGQRQRISLARALIRKPALLILDDATSALDPEVEREVLGNIAALTTGDGTRAMTVVIVAYRKTSIAFADRVLLLSDGRLVASGRHAQLARDNGEYRALVNAYDGTIGAAEGAA